MKKIYGNFLIIMLIATKATAQDFIVDSLRSAYENAGSDSIKISVLIALANHEFNDLNRNDTAVTILNSALTLAKQKALAKQEVEILKLSGIRYYYMKDTRDKGYLLSLQAISLARKRHLVSLEIDLLADLINELHDKPDSAELLIAQGMRLSEQYLLAEQQIKVLTSAGFYYSRSKPALARLDYLHGLSLARESHLPKSEASLLEIIAFFYLQNHWDDSSNFLIQQGLRVARENHLADKEAELLDILTYAGGGFFLRDSLMSYTERSLLLSRQLHRDSLEVMGRTASAYKNIGNVPIALRTYLIVLHAYEEKKDSSKIENTLLRIGYLYQSVKDFKNSIAYYDQTLEYSTGITLAQLSALRWKSQCYLGLKQDDSARYYADKAYSFARTWYHGSNMPGDILNDLGRVYFGLGEDSLAIDCLRRSFIWCKQNPFSYEDYTETTIGLADYFKKAGMADSSFFYAKLSLNTAQKIGLLSYISEPSDLIAGYYGKKHNMDSAYHYQQIGFEAYKRLYNEESSRQFENMSIAEQQRDQEIARAKKAAADQYASDLRLYSLLAILLIAFIIGFFIYRNNLARQKAYNQLKMKNQEIDAQKLELEASLSELKSTQSQLIQSEKMASLGDLTAGIAHEIQNPLNFVNNFSEVNMELISEMRAEIAKKNFDEIDQIAKDVEENETKIIHHGKRADAIVKGMLQHSRKSEGVKEQTDVNALVNEYLRLSFHGFRAKDNSFNATLTTEFDNSIGEINVVPQDIGRVLLNLFNNSFYAVNEKSNQPVHGYEPTVSVSTKKADNRIYITIKDNGNGISQNELDKIFQPFFTTKPTGQGTGLGLSLSYDIIKAHGGEIKVKTKENEGSEFIIALPLK